MTGRKRADPPERDRDGEREPTLVPADWQQEFLDQIAAAGDVAGVPPSFVRVLAWLVVCDPPHQSVEQLRAALGLSAGAVSMAANTGIRMGLVERLSRPGDRRLYYRVRPGGWDRLLVARLEATSRMRAIAERAIAQAPNATGRLAEMRDVYAWFEKNMSGLIDEFRRNHGTP